MKTKLKNIICSLVIAFAMLLSSNFSLALTTVNEIKHLSLAAYEATNLTGTPYEFTSNSGWTSYTLKEQTVKDSFNTSVVNQDLFALTQGDFTPATKYDGSPTNIEKSESQSETDHYAMRIAANNTPISAVVEKTDDKGKTIYRTDDEGNYIYEYNDESDETSGYKVYTSMVGSSDLYVKVADGDGYYKKVALTETKNTTYYFRTNSSLSLKSNNWYVVSAWIWTSNNGALASLYIKGTNFDAKIENINTNGQWKQYYIFLETSSDSNNSVNISFYYGNEKSVVANPDVQTTPVSGAIYLDNLCVKNISQTDYNNRTINGETNSNAADIIDYSARYNYALTSDISTNKNNVNGNFQNGTTLSIYDKLYGEEGYNKDIVATNNYYQYYINQYVEGSTTDKLTDNELANLYKAYEKVNISLVKESKEFETEKEAEEAGAEPTIVPGPNTFNADNQILKIENTSEKYTLGVLTAPIHIRQHSFYRFSVYIKGLEESDKATIKLISYIKTGNSSDEGAIQVKAQNAISAYTKSSDNTNNWTEVSFYIQGNCYRDTTFQVALLADTESTVYFDNMRLEGITSKNYTDASSSKRFDLSPTSTVLNGNITNGYFNLIESDKVNQEDKELPYKPDDWSTLSNNSEGVTAGIIPTNVADWTNDVATLIGGAGNPIGSVDLGGGNIVDLPKTNVLVMYAPKDGENLNFGYKSSDFTLSSNSVYKISFEVFAASATNAHFEGDVVARLVYSDNTIAEFNTSIEEGNTDTHGKWMKYTIVVRTGTTSRTCKIELGIKNATGTVFFQKVGHTKLAEKTVDGEKITVDTQYNKLANQYNTVALQESNNIRFVNHDGDAFVMHSQTKAENKDYYTSLSHSLKEAGEDKDPIVQGELGIVDTSKNLNLAPEYNLESSFITRNTDTENPVSEFAMMIYNGQNYNTVVNPKSTSTLSSSSYYQITFFVKTDGIANGNGLNVKMDKISVNFNNINTKDYTNEDTNNYQKYTVLVRTGTSSISGFTISYELGTENNKFTGLALISGVDITKLANVDEYNKLVETVEENDTTTIVKDFSATASNSSIEEVDDTTLATFFLVFSSILLVGVLVYAVIIVYIKKNPRSQTVTGTNNANVSSRKNNEDNTTSQDGFV